MLHVVFLLPFAPPLMCRFVRGMVPEHLGIGLLQCLETCGFASAFPVTIV